MSSSRGSTDRGEHAAATSRAQTAVVMAMTPQRALAELAIYVGDSAEKRAFGKTRAQAALVVLQASMGDADA